MMPTMAVYGGRLYISRDHPLIPVTMHTPAYMQING